MEFRDRFGALNREGEYVRAERIVTSASPGRTGIPRGGGLPSPSAELMSRAVVDFLAKGRRFPTR